MNNSKNISKNNIKGEIKMRKTTNIFLYSIIGTVLGAGLGIIAAKKICSKTTTLKKTAGKALRAAGSFIEHMSF